MPFCQKYTANDFCFSKDFVRQLVGDYVRLAVWIDPSTPEFA